MNEEKLIELMKEHFPTKGEFLGSVKDIRQDIAELKESGEQFKASSDALDTVLEAHPVKRINRLEDHLGLPKYVHATNEE